jgi:hypothetical protein
MIRGSELLAEFEREYLRQDKTDYFDSLRLVEEMWKEGVFLGVLPPEDPLEGTEVDLRIARILNPDRDYIRKWLKESDRTLETNDFSRRFAELSVQAG